MTRTLPSPSGGVDCKCGHPVHRGACQWVWADPSPARGGDVVELTDCDCYVATVGDVIDRPEVQKQVAELRAGFDRERMTEPGLSTYGPPTKTGIERIKRFARKYGHLPARS